MSTATTIIEALGGWENISNLEACITRIRLDAANTDLIDEAKLRAAVTHEATGPDVSVLAPLFSTETSR